jgi:hypothetical protein
MFDFNMKISDFENMVQTEKNKGYVEALIIVIKLLNDRICSDFKADSTCEHQVCPQNYELAEGLELVKRNKQ